jgi:hypothetical protein
MAFGRFGDAPPAQLASSPATDPPVEVVKNAARPANACFVFFRPRLASLLPWREGKMKIREAAGRGRLRTEGVPRREWADVG